MTADLRVFCWTCCSVTANEHIAICEPAGRGFRAKLTTVEKADLIAGGFAERDCYFSVQPIHERVATGRGLAQDVIGLRDLYADLDVKAGGMPDWDAARAVVNALSDMLGSEPVAVVMSGHGFQPHWAIERSEATDWADENDQRWSDAVALMRRWGRLVKHVATTHKGGADWVYDLARVLRVPGTTNRKAEPVRTLLTTVGGSPVSIGQIQDALDACGIEQWPEDGEGLGEIVARTANGISVIGRATTPRR